MVEVVRLGISELGEEWRPLIALETGGTPVSEFAFPTAGTLLLGSEELGLSREALDLAGARVSIPMAGEKRSLNVGVACGIALERWASALCATP
jgi:TrmH family RNA methyltransferase